MLRSLLTILFLLSFHLNAADLRVTPTADPTNTLNGDSWETATNLQRALALAAPGDNIWIQQGTYYPDEGQGQTADTSASTFTIPPGISLFGGFSGNETQPEDRPDPAILSILSGDLEQDDTIVSTGITPGEPSMQQQGTNASHVVTVSGSSRETRRMDQLQVTFGYTRIFQQNSRGAGILLQDSSLILTSCNISYNQSEPGGAAIFCDRSDLKCSDTKFSNNYCIESGAAILAQESTVSFIKCIVDNSYSPSAGSVTGTNTDFTIRNSQFSRNYSEFRGASISILPGSSLQLEASTFNENYCTAGNGIVYLSRGVTATATRCIFIDNYGADAGALYIGPEAICNVATSYFHNNGAEFGGAVQATSSSNSTFVNCSFDSNRARFGGALFISEASTFEMTNCTLYNNNNAEIGESAVGIFQSAPVFNNTIFWSENSSSGQPRTQFFYDLDQPTARFRNCIIKASGGSDAWDPQLGLDEGGNLDLDPQLFRSPPIGSSFPALSLQPYSPAIDRGNTTLLPEPLPFDIYGEARIAGGAVDIGCHELQGSPSAQPPQIPKLTPRGPAFTSDFALSQFFEAPQAFRILSSQPPGTLDTAIDPSTGAITIIPLDKIGNPAQLTFVATNPSGGESIIAFDIDIRPPVIYVDQNATGSGSGTSWENAFTTVQEAISVAGSDGEIWVARGIYYAERPDDFLRLFPRAGPGSDSFDLQSGQKIFGGFEGTEDVREMRNPSAAPTILTGSIASASADPDGDGIVTQAIQEPLSFGAAPIIYGSNLESDTYLDGFVITAGQVGGIALFDSSLQLVNCRLLGNNAQAGAGSTLQALRGSPLVTNCIFSGNTASGSTANFIDPENLIFANNTLINNTSTGGASAVRIQRTFFDDSPINANIINCIIWANFNSSTINTRTPDDLESNFSTNQESNISISNTILGGSGGTQNWNALPIADGGGNLDTDPLLFANLDLSTTSAMRLLPSSPAIDTGSQSQSVSSTTDAFGDPRTSGSAIDIGAHEFRGPGIPRPQESRNLRINPAANPSITISTAEFFASGTSDFRIEQEIPENSNSISVDQDTGELNLSFQSGFRGFITIALSARDQQSIRSQTLLNITAFPSRIYVDQSATGDGSGSNWENATPLLQNALISIIAPTEIWVAAGTYYPDEHTSDDETLELRSFQLPQDTQLYGGFAGTESSLLERTNEPEFTTTLSGDIDQDDITNTTPRQPGSYITRVGQNSETVVSASLLTSSTTTSLDGFTISGGGSDQFLSNRKGTALDFRGAPVTVRNCIFTNNYRARSPVVFLTQESHSLLENCIFEHNGSPPSERPARNVTPFLISEGSNAIFRRCTIRSGISDISATGTIAESSPRFESCEFIANISASTISIAFGSLSSSTFTSCIFRENISEGTGGVFHERNGRATFIGCEFVGNTAQLTGGAISSLGSSHSYTQCLFSGNSSVTRGGAIYASDDSSTHQGSAFISNLSADDGGAIYAEGSTTTIISSIFLSNRSGDDGGAMRISESSDLSLQHCTFSLNVAADNGGAITADSESQSQITNTIIWSNSSEGETNTTSASIRHKELSAPNIHNSIIQNSRSSSAWSTNIGVDLGGNLDSPPGFIAPIGLPGEFVIDPPSLALRYDSIAIDSAALISESAPLDYFGNSRSNDGNFDRIISPDIGAIEFQPVVSDSDSDGFADGFELLATGTPNGLPPFPEMTALGTGSQFSVTYEAEASILEFLDPIIETSEDLGIAAPWTPSQLTSIEEAGKVKIEGIFSFSEDEASPRFFRLRLQKKDP